jgi:hypothetical protein
MAPTTTTKAAAHVLGGFIGYWRCAGIANAERGKGLRFAVSAIVAS